MEIQSTKGTRTYYHTYLPIQYRLGLLTSAITASIPSSTLHNWKNLDLQRLYGYREDETLDLRAKTDYYLDQSRFFRKCASALIRIVIFQRKLIDTLQPDKKILESFKDEFISLSIRLSESFPKDKVLKYMGIQRQQLDYWKRNIRKCNLSFNGLCLVRHPNQLTSSEVNNIRRYMTNPRFRYWSGISVYHQMLRDQATFCGKSTFYQYVKWLGLSRKAPQSRRKKHSTGIRASKPFEKIHLDVTQFTPEQGPKAYIYVVMDNWLFRFK